MSDIDHALDRMRQTIKDASDIAYNEGYETAALLMSVARQRAVDLHTFLERCVIVGKEPYVKAIWNDLRYLQIYLDRAVELPTGQRPKDLAVIIGYARDELNDVIRAAGQVAVYEFPEDPYV